MSDEKSICWGSPALLTTRATAGATIELRDDELTARTQSVQAGEVRLSKEVVPRQQTIDVPVAREEVYVERQAANGRPADNPIGETGQTLRVPVRHEEVSVEKRAVVTEAVEVSKRAVQEAQQVSGSVRREVVDVDAEGDVSTRDRLERVYPTLRHRNGV